MVDSQRGALRPDGHNRSYPTRGGGIIVLLKKRPQNRNKNYFKISRKNFAYAYHICRVWSNGLYPRLLSQ